MDLDSITRVRNKATVIFGFCEMLLDQKFGPLLCEQRRILDELLEAAGELKDIASRSPRLPCDN